MSTKQDEPKALQMAEAMKRQQQQEDKSKGETNQRQVRNFESIAKMVNGS